MAAELKALSIEVERVDTACVRFLGDFYDMAKACLWLRTAERVLMEVKSFTALTFDELFEGVKAIDWKNYLARDSFIHVNGKSAKSRLFSVSDCQSITKKAIVENLRATYRVYTLPETSGEVIIEVGILNNIVTLALDPCGAGLSRRGYRTYNVDAPISETLGAAIVMLSRYGAGIPRADVPRAGIPLIDPMCGSGTMPIEAAMIAQNRAPGLNRGFSAEGWHFLNNEFSLMREQARDSITNAKLNILGSDIDARSIDLCKKHAKKAGVIVQWAVKPLKELVSSESGGIIVCNPPYGERMLKRSDTEKLYRQMREKFGELDDWSKNIITAYPDFERIYGKRADRRRKLSNGGMQCTLFMYSS